MSALPLPLLVGLLLCLFSFSCPAGAPLVRPCPCLALPVSSSYSPSTVLLRRILQPVSVFASSADATAAFFPHTFPFPILLPRLPPVPSSTHLPCFQTPHKETPPFKQKPPPSRRSPPPLFKKVPPPSRRSPPPFKKKPPPFQEAHPPFFFFLGRGRPRTELPWRSPPPQEEAPPLLQEAPPFFFFLGGGLPRTEDLPSKKLSLEEATPPLKK